jgi:hypothetical protein
MIMILQSNGSLDKWLTSEYSTLIQNEKKLSPLEKYEKLQGDKEALGLIRTYISEPLQKLTENIKTTEELWEFLKTKSMIVNSSEAIEYLQRSLWALKLEDLADTEQHIQQFNDIVAQLRENNVELQDSVLVSAALKSWPDSILTHKQIMQAATGVTLQTVESKLRALSVARMMLQKTEELETKTANAAMTHENDEHKNNRNKRKVTWGQTQNGGAMKNLHDYDELSDVPHESISLWEQHLDPRHKCRYGDKCWFRPSSNIKRPAIIKRFLESRRGRENQGKIPYDKEQ